MRHIDAVVLHTAAAYDAKRKLVRHPSALEIARYHREHNGWSDIGYHWYVEGDGRGVRGRSDTQLGAHVGGWNMNSLGLCVSGHGDFESWTPAQRGEALRKSAEWCRLYRIPVERVIGHREADDFGAPPVHKTCPGTLIDLDAFRAELALLMVAT